MGNRLGANKVQISPSEKEGLLGCHKVDCQIQVSLTLGIGALHVLDGPLARLVIG